MVLITVVITLEVIAWDRALLYDAHRATDSVLYALVSRTIRAGGRLPLLIM